LASPLQDKAFSDILTGIGKTFFMKADIHPEYFADATIACACGNKMKFGSTKQSIEVEICSQCHPYFTGKEKLIDTAGRVDKFKKRLTKVSDKPARRGKARK
jgi:large subunit ribosomal protein L31